MKAALTKPPAMAPGTGTIWAAALSETTPPNRLATARNQPDRRRRGPSRLGLGLALQYAQVQTGAGSSRMTWESEFFRGTTVREQRSKWTPPANL